MFPMTPVQSWAFLALVILLVICLARIVHDLIQASELARIDTTDEHLATIHPIRIDETEVIDQEPEAPARPQLTLLISTPARTADQTTTRLYDWAVDGI